MLNKNTEETANSKNLIHYFFSLLLVALLCFHAFNFNSLSASMTFDPTAPNFNKWKWETISVYAETSGVWGRNRQEQTQSSCYEINIFDHASDFFDFKNKYPTIQIDYNGYVSHNKAAQANYNSYHYLNTNTVSSSTSTSQIFHHYQGYVQNEEWGFAEVKYKLENNIIKIWFVVYARAKNGWNSMNAWARSSLTINWIKFESNFNFQKFNDQLLSSLNNGISYYSSINNNPSFSTNWKQIISQMEYKIKNALNDPNNTQNWINYLRPTYQLEKRNNSYYIKTFINIYHHQLLKDLNLEFMTPLYFDSDYSTTYAKNQIKTTLKETITYQSDISPSIIENFPAIKEILNNKIFNNLASQKGNIDAWKRLLNINYALVTENNDYFVKTSINIFNNLKESQENWVFKTKLNFSLSSKYWKTKIQELISITPGKIIDDNGINMITDIEEVINFGDGQENKYNKGTIKYHTKTLFQYIEPKQNPNDADYDIVTINGVRLNAVNGLYTYTFDDKEKINKYELAIIHKPNPKIIGDMGGSFNLTILIETINPILKLKLMNWGTSNIDYDKLTSKFIPDLSDNTKSIKNPNYDQEINKDTGTKKQLIWVRQKSNNAFPLDPIDKNGNLIKSNNLLDYDIGFLAEASAVGAGFENYYDSENIEEVTRYLANEKLETSFDNGYQLKRNKRWY